MQCMLREELIIEKPVGGKGVRMRVYVSIDAEGLPGIVSISQIAEGGRHFNELRKIMTRIAVACIDALRKEGVESVWISDSHGSMLNIDYAEIPRGVVLIRGSLRPVAMITGIDQGFDGAIFVGYHSAAGVAKSVMDHTVSGRAFHEIRVCGRRASEFYVNALVAGQYGVPVILVAGDDKLREDVAEATPWAVYIEMKRSITRFAAVSPALDDVIDSLRDGIAKAVENLRRGACRPLKPPKTPLDLEIVFRRSEYADAVEMVPGFERVDAYTVRTRAASPTELAKLIEVAALIALAVDSLIQR